jgi:hypothetical protein
MNLKSRADDCMLTDWLWLLALIEHPSFGERSLDIDLAEDEDGTAQATFLPRRKLQGTAIHACQADNLAR